MSRMPSYWTGAGLPGFGVPFSLIGLLYVTVGVGEANARATSAKKTALTPTSTASLRIISPGTVGDPNTPPPGEPGQRQSRHYKPHCNTKCLMLRCAPGPRLPARWGILRPVRTPPDAEIAAPEFPPGLDWLNVATLRMQNELGGRAVLLEFWDFARINSLRTLPYVKAWHERYSQLGLRVIGVHSPGYSFGRAREPVEEAVERLEIPYAVLLDPRFEVWRLYGNKGWPARYLFDRSGWLRFVHY